MIPYITKYMSLNRCIARCFAKNYCPKTIEATILKKVPNESKLIYAINIFIVATRFLLFSYGSNLNASTNSNDSFR